MTLWNPTDCSMLGSSVLHYLPEFAQIHVHWIVMLPNHLILCPPFTFCLQSFPASGSFPMSWLLVSGSQSIRASASASALPVNIQGWINWSNLPAVQGTLKSLLQHHNSKASILWRSALFMVQLSHPYMTSGKTTTLTIQTIVGKY